MIYYAQYDLELQIDAEDRPLLAISNWYLHPDGYAWNGKKLLHRVIMQAGKGDIVDHINGDKLDNRKCNLRFVTKSENVINFRMRADNKSGVKGVSWSTRDKLWVARISVNGKIICLGQSPDFDQVVQLRKEAEQKYHTLPGVNNIFAGHICRP